MVTAVVERRELWGLWVTGCVVSYWMRIAHFSGYVVAAYEGRAAADVAAERFRQLHIQCEPRLLPLVRSDVEPSAN